jgi:uncharacterized membrane protein
MQLPDVHPFVVHFPIALLILGSGAGLLYLFWRPADYLRTLTWIPLFLGWLGAILAVLTGLYAQSGLPPQAPYRPLLDRHVYTGFGVAILYAAPLYRHWLYARREGKRTGRDLLDEPGARYLLTAVFVLGLTLVVLTGLYGGQLVHQWGVNVQGITPPNR